MTDTTLPREEEMVIGGDVKAGEGYLGIAGATYHPQPSGNGSSPRAGLVAGEDIDPKYSGIDIVDTDADARAPKFVTAAMLNRFVEQNPDHYPVFEYFLHQTGIQMGLPGELKAKVRVVNLTDKTLMGTLPHSVRQLVEQLFFAGTPQGNRNKVKGAAQRMAEGLSRLERIGYAYGIAGFVEPQLVLRKEDVVDPDRQAWVGSIALHDLTEFSRICEGDDELAARRLAAFSERQDSPV